MTKTSEEWFNELDEMRERDEISEEEYNEETKGIMDKVKDFKNWVRKKFSRKIPSFQFWKSTTTSKTSTYRKRIESYMVRHPKATLKEARGHK